METILFKSYFKVSLVTLLFLAASNGISATNICCAGQGENNLSAPAKAVAGKLADTGQTKCYNRTSEIPCPQPGEYLYGQDAHYSGKPMSFTANGNGTVTDNVTGLMWQQQDDGVKRNWQESVDYCAGLSLAQYNDWRLPSKKEIISIVDYGRTDPAIDTAFFPGTERGWYWTSTSRAVDSFYAWGLFSANGRMHGSHKLGGSYAGHGRVYGGIKANDYYARCVRTTS